MTTLGGVKVLDFTRVHAGPFASMVLADLGATVLKIERPEGDESRHMSRFSYSSMSAFFVASNRNKGSRVLDLATPEGRERVMELVRVADIVIDNFRPGTLKRLSLDYESVARVNPRAISVSVTGYGEGTPDGDRPAYDLLAQARGGVMSLNGEPGRDPVKVGVPIGDLIAGLYAATGAIAALRERQLTGRGQRVEVAMLDAQVAMLHYHYSYYDASGELLPRIGSHHQNMAPYGIFRCSDGHLAIAVVPQPPKFWAALCETLGHPEWMEDERFSTPAARVANRAEMTAELESVMRTRTRREWFELLRDAGVPVAPLNDMSDLAEDEQIRARRMIVECTSAGYGRVRLPGNPIKMAGTLPEEEWTAPPELGDHEGIDPGRPDWRPRSSADGDGADEVMNPAMIAFNGTAGGYALRAWRCRSCGGLAFGIRVCCPVCGRTDAEETPLCEEGTLETWSAVSTREGSYVIGYSLVGAVDDPEQTVRVFGPIDVEDESELVPGEAMRIGFRSSEINRRDRVHHYFIPATKTSEESNR